jgi:hypothetical protein
VVVGKATLFAYIALCSFAILVCATILIISVCISEAKRIPETTAFPMWDTYAHCEIDDAGLAAQQQHFGAPKTLTGREMIRAMSKMSIKLSGREESGEGMGDLDYRRFDHG